MKCLQAKANVYNARLLGARRREVEQSAEAESDVTRQQKKLKILLAKKQMMRIIRIPRLEALPSPVL